MSVAFDKPVSLLGERHSYFDVAMASFPPEIAQHGPAAERRSPLLLELTEIPLFLLLSVCVVLLSS